MFVLQQLQLANEIVIRVILLQSQNNWRPYLKPCVNGLAFPYNPDNPRMAFCFLPPLLPIPPTQGISSENQPPPPLYMTVIKFDLPPSSHCSVGGILSDQIWL